MISFKRIKNKPNASTKMKLYDYNVLEVMEFFLRNKITGVSWLLSVQRWCVLTAVNVLRRWFSYCLFFFFFVQQSVKKYSSN